MDNLYMTVVAIVKIEEAKWNHKELRERLMFIGHVGIYRCSQAKVQQPQKQQKATENYRAHIQF